MWALVGCVLQTMDAHDQAVQKDRIQGRYQKHRVRAVCA